MHQRLFHTLTLFVAVLACGVFFAPGEMQAAEAVPNRSTITTGVNNVSVDPYQSFNFTVTLKDAAGNQVTTRPPGKIYIWATDANGSVSAGLDVVELSVPKGVYVHQTERQGVLIMDCAALTKPQRFNLTLASTGNYELHALYMASGAINPNNVTNYWPYELTGGTLAERSVNVKPTPASDVAMMVVSTKIRGIGVDSFLITNPRNQTLKTPISVDANSTTQTEVQLALLRDNGLSVGANVPIYIGTNSSALSVSNVLVRTNVNGVARFTVNGNVTQGATLQLRCGLNEQPVNIPFAAYKYQPQKVRLTIGSKEMNVDGRTMEMDTPPVIKDNRTFVPYRAIAELLGAKIEYDPHVRTITTTFNGTRITMSIGYNHYAVGGKIYPMDTAPYIQNNRTMVPIRFVAEVIGYDVGFNPSHGSTPASVVFTKK